jgi:hypothetical protein
VALIERMRLKIGCEGLGHKIYSSFLFTGRSNKVESILRLKDPIIKDRDAKIKILSNSSKKSLFCFDQHYGICTTRHVEICSFCNRNRERFMKKRNITHYKTKSIFLL